MSTTIPLVVPIDDKKHSKLLFTEIKNALGLNDKKCVRGERSFYIYCELNAKENSFAFQQYQLAALQHYQTFFQVCTRTTLKKFQLWTRRLEADLQHILYIIVFNRLLDNYALHRSNGC